MRSQNVCCEIKGLSAVPFDPGVQLFVPSVYFFLFFGCQTWTGQKKSPATCNIKGKHPSVTLFTPTCNYYTGGRSRDTNYSTDTGLGRLQCCKGVCCVVFLESKKTCAPATFHSEIPSNIYFIIVGIGV